MFCHTARLQRYSARAGYSARALPGGAENRGSAVKGKENCEPHAVKRSMGANRSDVRALEKARWQMRTGTGAGKRFERLEAGAQITCAICDLANQGKEARSDSQKRPET